MLRQYWKPPTPEEARSDPKRFRMLPNGMYVDTYAGGSGQWYGPDGAKIPNQTGRAASDAYKQENAFDRLVGPTNPENFAPVDYDAERAAILSGGVDPALQAQQQQLLSMYQNQAMHGGAGMHQAKAVGTNAMNQQVAMARSAAPTNAAAANRMAMGNRAMAEASLGGQMNTAKLLDQDAARVGMQGLLQGMGSQDLQTQQYQNQALAELSRQQQQGGIALDADRRRQLAMAMGREDSDTAQRAAYGALDALATGVKHEMRRDR